MSKRKPELRTLWKANLKAGINKDQIFFRSTEEFEEASATVIEILLTTDSLRIAGAVVFSLERVARLWN